jgi:hypothetical protein
MKKTAKKMTMPNRFQPPPARPMMGKQPMMNLKGTPLSTFAPGPKKKKGKR